MTNPKDQTSLIARAGEIVLRPRQTWRVIAVEQSSIGRLFTRYVMVLCAISPIAFTIGRLVFGEKALGVIYRPPMAAAIVEGLASYLLTVAAVWGLALLIEYLAPPFGGVRDRLSAFKLAAYSGTAGWLASVVYVYPPAGPLVLIGLIYNFNVLYSGAQILVRITGRQTFGYVSLVVVCYMVLMMLVISLTKVAAALIS